MKTTGKLEYRMKWRQNNTYVGLDGVTEPSHIKGSAAMYKTGAEITPLNDWMRANYKPPPPSESNYEIHAWVKRGHLKDEQEFDGYSTTVEEGKRRCDEWLSKRT